jgi:predicted TPR repeat methyltransferase
MLWWAVVVSAFADPDAQAWQRAAALFAIGDATAAASAYEDLAKADPEHETTATAWFNAAIAHDAAGSVEPAVRTFRAALTSGIEGDEAAMARLRVCTLRSRAEHDDTLEACQAFLTHHPEHRDAPAVRELVARLTSASGAR